jgi:hypothetical protein
MSLAMYAAPFDHENQTTNHIEKKRGALNKTQRRYGTSPKEEVNTDKVLSVLQTIHNLPYQENELGDFNPLPPPESAGVESTKARSATPQHHHPVSDDTATNNYSEAHNQNMAEDFYRRYIPDYDAMYKASPANVPEYKFSNATVAKQVGTTNDVLMEKLNYMINLLEEQQDERTGNVTEEVILYSFLGIFIIFVVDSFSRANKYTR